MGGNPRGHNHVRVYNMVTSATSLGRTGLQDWLIQRISAIILAGYFSFIAIYLGVSQYFNHLNYITWHTLFENPWMKFFTLVAFLSLVAHAWIGFWTVSTDYVKSVAFRLILQVGMMVFLFAHFAWAFVILWSI